MPGLPKVPASDDIDIDADGNIGEAVAVDVEAEHVLISATSHCICSRGSSARK